MVGARQGVAVEHLDPVAGHQGRHLPAQFLDDALAAAGVVADHLAHDGQLDALELLVDALEGDGEPVGVFGVDGAGGLVEAAGDQGHGFDDGGEQQLAGVLVDGQAVEEFIQGLGLEGILQQGAGHDGQRGACGETLEEGLEQHAGGLWMARATTQRQTTGSGRGRGCRAHQQTGQPHECSVSFAANGCEARS